MNTEQIKTVSRRESPRVRKLEDGIARLLDSLGKQRFPPGDGARCRYSMNLEDAIRHGATLVSQPTQKADERDLVRPEET